MTYPETARDYSLSCLSFYYLILLWMSLVSFGHPCRHAWVETCQTSFYLLILMVNGPEIKESPGKSHSWPWFFVINFSSTGVSRKFRQANQSDVQTHEQAIFIFQGVFLAVFNTLVFLLSTHRIVRIWRLERTLGTSHDITREFLSTQGDNIFSLFLQFEIIKSPIGLMRFGFVFLFICMIGGSNEFCPVMSC